MSFHAEVYHLARDFEISELRELAIENLNIYMRTAWDADEFVKALESLGCSLCDHIIPICCEHIAELLTKPKFQVILGTFQLGSKLTDYLGRSLRSYFCPQCNQTWSLDCSTLSSLSFCPGCGHHEEDWDNFMK